MKLKSAKSTTKIVKMNGKPHRIWEAVTENGIKCFLFVTGVMVHDGEDQTEFERELDEQSQPCVEAEAIPLRLVT